MIIRRLKFAVVLILFAMTASASAATVVMDGVGTATDILGLDIGGSAYNVSFEYDSFNDLNTGGNFPFLGNAAGAQTAEAAILAALNSSSAFYVGPSAAQSSGGFSLPYDTQLHPFLGTPQVLIRFSSYAPSPADWVPQFTAAVDPGSDRYYAVITAVPVPAAVWFFGSALGLLGWLRKSKSGCRHL